MAMSLEDLLVEEGFKGRRLKTMTRASFGSEPRVYPFRDQHKSGSSSGVKKTERTKSDITRYTLRGESPKTDGVMGRRGRENLVRRELLDRGSIKETKEKLDRRGSQDTRDARRSSFDSPEYSNEIVEVGVQDDKRYKDIYSNEMYSPARIKGKHSNGTGERERYRIMSEKEIKVDKRYGNNSNKQLFGRMSSTNNPRKSMKQPETSYSKSDRSSSLNSKSFDDSRNRRQVEIEQAVAEPALDEIAIQAIISILSGYVKSFLKDEDFRTLLRHNCFASLNFVGLEEGLNTESKVISNLEQAIEAVERAAEQCASANELKKASLQLSVITGLNANDLKDGFTSGIPNSRLSACAHLYLSVIYKLQKKDRIAAKHLLQMFCDSPFQSRTTLLPELWDYIFLPHLSHLKAWYNQEADSLADTPNKARKLKLLEKVYNEILDSGTYQFAVYYKDWITEGVEAPSIPSIQIPSISVRGVQQGGLNSHSPDVGSPLGPFSPQPMVSKKLYDAVFSRLHNPGADEVEYSKEAENFDNSIPSSDSSVVEDKGTLTYSFEAVKSENLDIALDGDSHPKDGVADEKASRLHRSSVLGERNLNDKVGNSYLWQAASRSTHMFHALPNTKANELTLKRLAKSVFEMQQTVGSVDLIDSTLHSDNEPYPNPSPTKIRTLDEGGQEGLPSEMIRHLHRVLFGSSFYGFHESNNDLHGNYEYFDAECFFSSIPPDFRCPLTGLPFEDPVTLETGQNFERVAITEWLSKGNRTCPVTGNTLQHQAVPLTNFILKRVVDSWKSEHCRHLLAFASQVAETSRENMKFKDELAVFIIEQLLTVFSKEERITNAKHLISLGGLQFLIRRFEYGNLEEKTCVAALLSCCIEAESGCRNHIARNIEKSCFLELLHSKQVKSRANVVLLLTELICLNRRNDVKFFLSGLQNEGIVNTMHVLLVYLQSCTPELRPLVAVLILHLDPMVEPRKYSIYREEAVDAITVALDSSLSDEKVREKCCRVLLILGGRFSFSGKIMTEDWILKQAGFLEGPESEVLYNKGDKVPVDENIPLDGHEEEDREKWLTNLSASLLGDGKKSFLETISTCLGSGHLDLVRVCLITVAWLSSAIASLPDAEFQLSAFSALISRLKENLENGERIEHKILASVSLLNFSKIPECRVLLMKIAEEISVPLRCLAEVTWTAKELYTIISWEDL